MFDHGGFEHGHALWQEVVQPPLVVWGRDVVPGRDETPVSLVDLAPTVAAFTGLAAAGGSDGRSLWPRLRDEGSLPERDLLVEAPLYGKRQQAAIRWPHKLIWSSETGSEALYDLSLDPDEARPLVLPDTASALRGRAEGRGGSGDSNPVVLDPETLQALRDLGYAEPGDD